MKKAYLISALCVLLLPVWMLLAWYVTPKKKLVAAIIDKTVMTRQGQEHAAFTWILKHEKYTKTANDLYSAGDDYFGFFPKDNEKFRIRGLERFSSSRLERLSNDCDLAYFTDTYGIIKNEWHSNAGHVPGGGVLYGGLSTQDLALMQKMKEKKKLVITEFNTIGSPTQVANRQAFEKMFALQWTGWTCRYFSSFDTALNKELPAWLVNNYKRDHNGSWPFHRAGVAFIHEEKGILILEDTAQLADPMPYIRSTAYGQHFLHLPEKIKYPFWFDVIIPDDSINKTVASFNVNVNEAGRALMEKNGIPASFPAVLMHKGPDYEFYYFSGDFCDNPVTMTSAYFKGIGYFKSFFYNEEQKEERASFFWNYYRPLMTGILKGYYERGSY